MFGFRSIQAPKVGDNVVNFVVVATVSQFAPENPNLH